MGKSQSAGRRSRRKLEMKLQKTELSGSIPVWQHDKASHHAQGGFNLDTTGLTAGTIVPAGSAVGYDEATRVATLIKSATLVEALEATGKAVKVAKGHLFIAGDFIIANGKSTKINTINTSNADYDVLNVVADLGVTAEGTVLLQGAAEAGSNAVLITEPKGLTYLSVKVPADDVVLVDVRLRGTIYARRAPALTQAVKDKLPRIIFSDSF